MVSSGIDSILALKQNPEKCSSLIKLAIALSIIFLFFFQSKHLLLRPKTSFSSVQNYHASDQVII